MKICAECMKWRVEIPNTTDAIKHMDYYYTRLTASFPGQAG